MVKEEKNMNTKITLISMVVAAVLIGGAIVLSGVLEDQIAVVSGAYRRWFTLGAWGTDDGWVALTGRRDMRAMRSRRDRG